MLTTAPLTHSNPEKLQQISLSPVWGHRARFPADAPLHSSSEAGVTRIERLRCSSGTTDNKLRTTVALPFRCALSLGWSATTGCCPLTCSLVTTISPLLPSSTVEPAALAAVFAWFQTYQGQGQSGTGIVLVACLPSALCVEDAIKRNVAQLN